MEGGGVALMDFRRRFDELKISDSQRQSLIQMSLDLESERTERRRLQNRINDELEPLNNRRSFVLVLIDADGDGYIFRDVYLNKGEDGGKYAADALLGEVKTYLKQLGLPAAGSNTDVVVRAYANLRGLGRACLKYGWMDATTATMTTGLQQFANGFTGRQPLFDFVDVGDGKEKADQKIKDVFSFHIANPQCAHVFLGVSHDSGYVPFLGGFAGDPSYRDRITLLHGHQISPAIQKLGFSRSVKFTSVFAPAAAAPFVPSAAPQQQPKIHHHHPPPPSPHLNQPQAATTTTKQSNRAPKGPFISPNTDSRRLGPILKNANGHRIDRPLNVEPSLQQAMAKKNLCVWLFLKGHCDGCVRNHSHKPLSEKEYEALWLVARQGQCFGYRKHRFCVDPGCVYGHGH
ncbi:MAG: hypothetical protein Q9203_007673 [Teloschistes exilis]